MPLPNQRGSYWAFWRLRDEFDALIVGALTGLVIVCVVVVVFL